MSMLGARKPKHWIKGAIKHPGKLTAEAAASGRSKLQQAEVDAKSSDPSKRGREASRRKIHW